MSLSPQYRQKITQAWAAMVSSDFIIPNEYCTQTKIRDNIIIFTQTTKKNEHSKTYSMIYFLCYMIQSW